MFYDINKVIKELSGAVVYMLFTVFSLDMRKDAMAGFLPPRQEMIHHCVSGSLRTLPNLNHFFFLTENPVVLNLILQKNIF